jgi:hypothetical protein
MHGLMASLIWNAEDGEVTIPFVTKKDGVGGCFLVVALRPSS